MKIKNIFGKFSAAVLAFAAVAFGVNYNAAASGGAPILQNFDITSWSETAEPFRGRDNERFAFDCSPLPRNKKLADYTVYGWQTYADDSSVCAAAVHAGIIKPDAGGRGWIEIRPGRRSYEYKSSNGVEGYSRGEHPGSFVFVAGNVTAAPPNSNSANERILVKGNPPLAQSAVDKIVKYYEWIFGGEFTRQERAALQSFVVNNWNDKTIQNYVAVMSKGFDDLSALDAGRAARKRNAFLTSIPADAEKYPDDPLGKILKPIYDRTQNRNAASKNDDNRNAQNNKNARDNGATTRSDRGASNASDAENIQDTPRATTQTADFSRMPKLRKQPNRAVGWVADAAGNPIAGATVYSYAFSLVTSQMTRAASAKTGADGSYSVPLNPITVYEVKAVAPVNFNNRRFYLHCNPTTESKAEKGSIGIVQNFVLTGSGLKQEADADPTKPESYTGAQITVENPSLDLDAFTSGTMFTFTLKPVGKLANGTNGTTLVFRRTLKMLRQGDYKGLPIEETQTIHDIPLGDYELSVVADISGAGKVRIPLYGKDNVSDLWDTDEPPVEKLAVRFQSEALDYGGGIKVYTIRLQNPPQYQNR